MGFKPWFSYGVMKVKRVPEVEAGQDTLADSADKLT